MKDLYRNENHAAILALHKHQVTMQQFFDEPEMVTGKLVQPEWGTSVKREIDDFDKKLHKRESHNAILNAMRQKMAMVSVTTRCRMARQLGMRLNEESVRALRHQTEEIAAFMTVPGSLGSKFTYQRKVMMQIVPSLTKKMVDADNYAACSTEKERADLRGYRDLPYHSIISLCRRDERVGLRRAYYSYGFISCMLDMVNWFSPKPMTPEREVCILDVDYTCDFGKPYYLSKDMM